MVGLQLLTIGECYCQCYCQHLSKCRCQCDDGSFCGLDKKSHWTLTRGKCYCQCQCWDDHGFAQKESPSWLTLASFYFFPAFFPTSNNTQQQEQWKMLLHTCITHLKHNYNYVTFWPTLGPFKYPQRPKKALLWALEVFGRSQGAWFGLNCHRLVQLGGSYP